MHRHLRGDAGSNAVEFALVLPILIVLVFGMMWGGLAFNRQLTITQAAREGARFGATLPFPDDAPDDAWFDEIRTAIVNTSAGHLNADNPPAGFVCIRYVPASGPAPPPRSWGTPAQDGDGNVLGCTVGGPAPSGARVEVVTERTATIDLVFHEFNPRLRGEGIARHEQRRPPP